jgi:APA family basic amino acid/polyamine antiporter
MATTTGKTGGARPRSGLFIRKPTDQLVTESSDSGLSRSVGALDLTALGVGVVIGAGIYVIIGEAIPLSGPAIVLSFVFAGITCVFSALSYAELASTIPVSGSAYTYAYATLGELVAWIIGWDLILEYGLGAATVAVGWGGYLQDLLASVFGLHLPDAISGPPGQGGAFNLPAVVLVAAVTALLIAGVRESTRTNTLLVVVKVAVLIFFVVVGLFSFHGSHFTPFMPHGLSGAWDAAAIIFFAYIGFDAVSTSGEEARNPKRDLPIGIIGSLAICTVIYIAVSVVAVGLVPADALSGSASPLATALRKGGAAGPWAADILSIGALVAITSVTLSLLYGQSRVMFAMCRDELLPRGLAALSARRTPWRITLIFGVAVAVLSALVPLSEIAKLVNIGTLFAFVIVNVGVIVLRRAQPDLDRGFRVPFVPVFPIIGTGLCLYLMTKLSGATWVRFGVWLAVGLVIYFAYGRSHSRMQRGETERPGGDAGPQPAA